MPTLRQAAALLTSADTADGRRAIAQLLGFTGEPLSLDRIARRQLRLPDDIVFAELAQGRGALRVLLVDEPDASSLRSVVAQISASLAGSASHALWVVIASAARGAEVGVAVWTRSSRGTRVLALVAQRSAVVASDAETLLALSDAGSADDLTVHARWCELLGREALSRRFYRVLEQRVQLLAHSLPTKTVEESSELALLHVSRLLFLSFLETKGWLNGDHAFLSRQLDSCMGTGGHFHQRVLLPLFFGTLNTRTRHRATTARRFGAIPFLNGGLFAKTPLERRYSHARFSDDAFAALFSDVFGAFRFTARETEMEWMEATIDPEMLGRAFESLMAARERRTSGAFYTPHDLVVHVTERALVNALSDDVMSISDVESALRSHQLDESKRRHLRTRLEYLTVLDPACGSGAFLVYVLERLADLLQLCGDDRDLATIRREVLGRSIHGVDINSTAVWLCELRLWLSVVIESTETRMGAVPPLPNLDCNVRVGDSLAGHGFAEPASLLGPPAALARLHARYVRASGPGKAPLRKAIVREERRRALAAIDRELIALSTMRRERIRARRAADLFGERSRSDATERDDMRRARRQAETLRRERKRLESGGALPFSFPSHFGSVHARGGFQLVIGNPPWVRLHNIPAPVRLTLRARYAVYRDAAWTPDSQSTRASTGFASQVDMAALFVERGAELVAPSGCVALLLPAKLLRSLAGGGMRRLLGSRLSLCGVEDWTAAPSLFDAAVYPSVVIARRDRPGDVVAAVRIKGVTAQWTTDAASLRFLPGDSASPLLLLPPPARRAFELVRECGLPLSQSPLGSPLLGVKCGCNDAFLVNAVDERGNIVDVEHAGRRGRIERELLRPLLRGEAVTRWTIQRQHSAIVWTHDDSGLALKNLPPFAGQWLAPWKRDLVARTDLRSPRIWWTLFRTESAMSDETRVVWSDFGRRPRAAVLPAGDSTVPLNTCYVVRSADRNDALALCTLINSLLAAAWLNTIAEPARGGWHRYLAWTVALLPIPRDWTFARSLLVPLAERAMEGELPGDDELLEACARAYGIRARDLEPLLEWTSLHIRD